MELSRRRLCYSHGGQQTRHAKQNFQYTTRSTCEDESIATQDGPTEHNDGAQTSNTTDLEHTVLLNPTRLWVFWRTHILDKVCNVPSRRALGQNGIIFLPRIENQTHGTLQSVQQNTTDYRQLVPVAPLLVEKDWWPFDTPRQRLRRPAKKLSSLVIRHLEPNGTLCSMRPHYVNIPHHRIHRTQK